MWVDIPFIDHASEVHGLKIDDQNVVGANNYAIKTGLGEIYLGDKLTWRPAASATPVNNGDATFELTSDTQIKIKVKGSDGVVRSATIALA